MDDGKATLSVKIGVDVGTSSIKASAFSSQTGLPIRKNISAAATETLVSSFAYGVNTSEQGKHVEQDPEEQWWRGFIHVLTDLLNQLTSSSVSESRELSKIKVEAICLGGQMQTVVLTSSSMEKALRPAILYSDTRANIEAKTIEEAFSGTSGIKELTGNWKGSASCLPKLLWLYNNEPDSLLSADGVLFGGHSYIAWKILLKKKNLLQCDFTTASTTGLLLRDSPNWCFDELKTRSAIVASLMVALDGKIPNLINSSNEPSGSIDLHELLAIDTFSSNLHPKCFGCLERTSTLVYHGAGDVATTSAGAKFISRLLKSTRNEYLYLGTSGWIAQVTPSLSGAQTKDTTPGVFHLLSIDPTKTIRAAPLTTAGGCLDLLKSLFSESLCKTHKCQSFHDVLFQTAGTSPPGSNKLLFLPHLNGERSPISDPYVRGGFIGLTGNHKVADMVRAALEGICFQYRWLAETLGVETLRSCNSCEPLAIIGGGARSSVWRQIFADVLNLPIAYIDIGVDTTTLGTAAIVGGIGELEVDEVRKRMSVEKIASEILFPSIDDGIIRLYDDLYIVWKDMFMALRSPFEKLSRISQVS